MVKNSLVLLDGPPLSGVTRSMDETVRRRLPNARLAPFTALGLAEFSARSDVGAQFSSVEQTVLRLDDLSPADLVLLGHGVLDDVLPHALVMATMATAWCERLLKDGSAVTAPARAVLVQYAKRVSVAFAMTPREEAALREMGFPVSKGFAESIVGGESLVRRYRRRARSHREGHLLVQAAVDARRCGIHRPLGTEEMYRLWCVFGDYEHDRCCLAFPRALDWARALPRDAGTGLLVHAAGGTSPHWRVLSYAAGADDGDHGHEPRPLGDHERNAVLTSLPDAADQFAIGIAAHLHDRRDTAKAALTQAAEAAAQGHPAGAAAAAALY
ncbi:hypothetical protein AB0G32_13940 [Streptomyces sp. NPDC023723]|uniref:hypothetical protein n=1 Tax=Streptomyces sp. NPDC023723 TaxID=3154323 RepID=UPI0034037100